MPAALPSLESKLMMPVATAEHIERIGIATYAKRATWSRSSSSRWLNDRAAAVNAAFLRRGWLLLTDELGRARPLPRQPGDFLKLHQTPAFDRIHARLAALSGDAAREAATVPEIVR